MNKIKKSSLHHKLMVNNISINDNKSVIKFLKTNPILTNNKKVKIFEEMWSKWLGVKYSVFVNSGSSANLVSISYLRTLYSSGEIIVPTLTWVSDITSILYSNFKPVFVDINLETLSLDDSNLEKVINKKTRAIFITHLLGLNGLTDKILKLVKKYKIYLIEDVCESHGAKFRNKKLGSFGDISNFSFYYAHHMSTIEGGMVCTNKKNIYEKIRIMRGHGLLRESTDKNLKIKKIKEFKDLNKEFLFLHPGYNLRSTEINAVYGISQIKNLDKNNQKRIANFKFFLKNLDDEKYVTNFNINGSCNYAFIILFNKKYRNLKFRENFESTLNKNNIEHRRGLSGGGDQTRQPYLRYFKNKYRIYGKLKNTDIVHNYGFYIGNYPSLKKSKILQICKLLNSI
jgi:CDP-4-dehydro-6-deoxyglucose reductase, E1